MEYWYSLHRLSVPLREVKPPRGKPRGILIRGWRNYAVANNPAPSRTRVCAVVASPFLPAASRGASWRRRVRQADFFLVAVLFLAAGIGLADEELIPLIPQKVAGMDFSDGQWITRTTLYVEGERGFCIEAEKASSLLEPGMRIFGLSKDKTATGGVYLVDPDGLRFEVRVSKGGKYALKLRMRKNPKTWRSYRDHMNKDAGEKRSPEVASVKVDGNPIFVEPFKRLGLKWGWQHLGTFPLTAGLHVLSLAELSGYHLDRVLFLSVSEAEADAEGKTDTLDLNVTGGDDDFGELDDIMTELADFEKIPASKRQVVDVAQVVTHIVQPLSVAQWRKLTVCGDFAGCEPDVSVSTDGGETWRNAPNGDILGLKTEDAGTDSLCARVQWRPSKPEQVPTLSGIDVSYVPGKAESLLIVGRKLSVVMNKRNGCLYEFRDAENGEWLALPLRRELFTLGWIPKGGGEAQTFSASQFSLNEAKKEGNNPSPSWTLTFSHTETALWVVCRITPSSEAEGLWKWQLKVINKGEGVVCWVRFPHFPDIMCGGQNRLFESLWSVRDSGIFPGNLSMGYVFTTDGKRGLYLASLDKTLTDVRFTARTQDRTTLVSATSYGVVTPGKERYYEYAMAKGSPDWHWAADRYREWAYSWMKRPERPLWTCRIDGWWSHLADSEAALLDRRSTTIFEDARWFGLPYLQLWVGCGDGEFCGRLPYLSPRLGTPEMSRKDCERIHRLGGHIGHYIQAQEWDAGFATADIIGFIPRKYFPVDFTVEDWDWSNLHVVNGPWTGRRAGVRFMCAASEGWQEHIARHAAERVALFGNDAAYFDQMGCIVQSCSSRAHAHSPEYQVSGAGFTLMAEKALAGMRKHNHDVAIAQEGMSAATGQHVHFHLASSRPYIEHGKEFLYTFPDLAVFRGSGNGVLVNQQLPARHFFRDLYLFHRFEIPVFDLYFRDVILLRQRIHDWQYDGRFMDDVGLVASAKGVSDRWERNKYVSERGRVRAKWFFYLENGTAGLLINFRNEDKVQDSTLSLERSRVAFDPSGHAFTYYDDGTVEPMRYELREEALVFVVPPRQVGSILVPGPVSPEEALRPFACQSTESGPDRLMLTAVNISDKPIKANWSVSVPDGFSLAVTSGVMEVEAFGVRSTVVPIRNLPAAEAMGEAVVDWTYADQKKSCGAVLSPPLRNGSMELDENGDGSPDSWWNFNNGFCHQIHRYAHDVDMRALPTVCDTQIKRSGRAGARLHGPVSYAFSVDNVFGRKGEIKVYPGEISQHLYLKPSTRYRVSAYALWKEEGAKCELSVAGKKVCPIEITPNQWTQLSVEFTTGSTVVGPVITLANRSEEGVNVWFDDVTIEEQVEKK